MSVTTNWYLKPLASRQNKRGGNRRNKRSNKNKNKTTSYLAKFQDGSRVATMLTVPPRSESGFAPDRLRTRMRYHNYTQIVSGTSNSSSIRFEPTFAYDVDPLVGSTAMPGFTEYAGLYRKYRVNGFIATVVFANTETSPVLCYLSVLNSDPGTSVLPATAQNILSQPITKRVMVGPLTGNSASRELSLAATIANFAGSSNREIDDSYSAFVTGTAPSNNMWLIVGCIKQAGTLTAGVQCDIMIDVDIEFFEVQTPAS